MPGNYDNTHMKILTSAKKIFLEHGYEPASLRTICKDAGVTTGAFYRHFPDKESLFAALVEPVVQGAKEIYTDSEEESAEYLNAKEITHALNVSYKAATKFIDYIYDNFDCFKLILMRSEGTKYSSFVDDLVMLEVNERENLFAILRRNQVEFHEMQRKVSHLLTDTYFASVFKVVNLGLTREEAFEYVNALVTYSNAGWRAILGI